MAETSYPIVVPSLAALNADLSPNAGTLRQIANNPPGPDDGIYQKVGASGTGSWQWLMPSNSSLSVLYWSASSTAMRDVTVTRDDGNLVESGGGGLMPLTAAEVASTFFNGGVSSVGSISVPKKYTTDLDDTIFVVIGAGQSLRRGSFTAPTFNTANVQFARACSPYITMPDCGIIVDGRPWSIPIPAYEDIALTPGIYESGFVALMNRLHNRIFADLGKRIRIFGFVEAKSGAPLGLIARGSERYNNILLSVEKIVAYGAAQGKRVIVWGVAMQHGNADYFDLWGPYYAAYQRNLATDLNSDIRYLNPGQQQDPIWFLRHCDVASSATANSEASGAAGTAPDDYWHDFTIGEAQIELCRESPILFVSTGTPNTLKVDGTHNDTLGTIWDAETQAEIMADRLESKGCVPFAIMPEKTRWISATKFRVVAAMPAFNLVKDLSNFVVDTTLINDTLGWRFDYYGRYPDNTPGAVAPTITSLTVVGQPPSRPMFGYGAIDVQLSGTPLAGDGITRCLHVGMKVAANPLAHPCAPLSWASNPSAPYRSARTPFRTDRTSGYQGGFSDVMANGAAYAAGSLYARPTQDWLIPSLTILP